MYVRTRGDPAGFIGSVRSILRKLAPSLPFADAFTLEQEVQESLWQERLVTILCAFFGPAALVLSATGLYGNLAYSIARRTKEIGIRLALGAQVTDILLAVSARVVWAVGLGLLAGISTASFLLRLARSLVFGVEPLDPVSFVLAVAVLVVCSLIALVPPSWHAVKVEINAALRQE